MTAMPTAPQTSPISADHLRKNRNRWPLDNFGRLVNARRLRFDLDGFGLLEGVRL